MQQKYRVNGNLKDEQGTYTTGDIVLRTSEYAEPLVAIGRLEPVAEENVTVAEAAPAAPAAPDTMTAQQTGATMTARPDQGVQTPPTQQPAAQPTAETKPAEAQAPTQTATNQPTPEQIAHDVAEL